MAPSSCHERFCFQHSYANASMMATSVAALSFIAVPLVTAFRATGYGSQTLSHEVDASRYEYNWQVTVVGSTFKELSINGATMQAGGTLKTAAESASKLDIVLERDSTDEDVDVKMEAKALGLPLKFSGAFVHGTNLSQKSPISAPLHDLQQKTIGNLELKGSLVPHVADITGSVADDYSSIHLTVNFQPVSRGTMRTLYYTPGGKATLKFTVGGEVLNVKMTSV